VDGWVDGWTDRQAVNNLLRCKGPSCCCWTVCPRDRLYGTELRPRCSSGRYVLAAHRGALGSVPVDTKQHWSGLYSELLRFPCAQYCSIRIYHRSLRWPGNTLPHLQSLSSRLHAALTWLQSKNVIHLL
jgi:hypothetical protein